MKKKRQGFTLIELLAVIVILGLLMAIAIPSVTKYITQSRKKTLTTTIGNYMGALTTQVNDMEYVFTATNTIYAVPIECIALERGGTNPFGKWHQSNDKYWAYVLVQYDDETSSYIYGFTFKDSAGYGIYPTSSEKLNENGKQIQTGLSLTRPTNGNITNITIKDNWLGFDVDDNTSLVVLEAESEGTPGNGETTCTLCQKGDNYEEVETEKKNRPQLLNQLIKEHNTLITSAPTLTTSIGNSSDASGLYSSTNTNSGQPTYFFRGNVNNYVSFAGLTWRIVRINEDGTIRLILYGRINNTRYKFNSYRNNYSYTYYSNNSIAKQTVDNWYKTNITDKGYDSYVATGTFCEQAKLKPGPTWVNGNASLVLPQDYIANFKCTTDGNGKGTLKLKAGLITYDEVTHAGAYEGKFDKNHYLYLYNINAQLVWTMNPMGGAGSNFYVSIINNGQITIEQVDSDGDLLPVINLNANVLATGTGTSSDPYVVQTN